MKANIKVTPWIPLVFAMVAVYFIVQDFDVLSIIMVSGALLIVVYFLLAFFKRNDALTIEGHTMQVRSPFKTREFDISKISSVFTRKGDNGLLKATYEEDTVALCTNIYDKSIYEVKDYLLQNYPHIEDKSES